MQEQRCQEGLSLVCPHWFAAGQQQRQQLSEAFAAFANRGSLCD